MDELLTMRQLPCIADSGDDARWLADAKLGERDALERLYRMHHQQVYSLCYRMLGRAEDAEDAMQATFVHAFRALGRFRGTSSVQTWLYRITINEVLTTIRRRPAASAELDECSGAADETPATIDRVAARTALTRIREDHRAILILRYWEELSCEEIRDVLCISMPAVKMRLKRARDEFRKWYGEDL